MKYTRFRDIPQFTSCGSYRVNVGWHYLKNQLKHLSEPSGIELDPDFQRAHVWTTEKQIAYVEFILRGGRSAREIYWNCTSWMKGFNTPVVLVDGKQRLQAVRRFMANEIPAFESYRREYTDTVPLITADFTFIVNDLPTRKQVLQWYLDLNAGGVVHTEAELAKVRKLLDAEDHAFPDAR